jgi:hypothetical protein
MSITRTGHVTHLNAGDGTRPACGQRGALNYASVPDGVTCRHCRKWMLRLVLGAFKVQR